MNSSLFCEHNLTPHKRFRTYYFQDIPCFLKKTVISSIKVNKWVGGIGNRHLPHFFFKENLNAARCLEFVRNYLDPPLANFFFQKQTKMPT